MKKMELLRENILKEIKELGYESLRYSVFNEHGLSEWETRIEFNNATEKYEVYLTRDRSGVGHSKEYDNFESAKKDFFEKLELVIESNKLNIQLELSPEYPSPLWDEKEEH